MPGGPVKRRLWWPATAMVRARLAADCPAIWSRRTGGVEGDVDWDELVAEVAVVGLPGEWFEGLLGVLFGSSSV